MRQQWSCPDITAEKEPGRYLPVPGCNQEFPECPAAYLRTGADVQEIRSRRGRAFDDHLIEGTIHPATIVSTHAIEIKNGARNVDTLSPKMQTLVHIYLREEAARDRHDMEMRREKRG